MKTICKKFNLGEFIISIAIPLATGGIAALLTAKNMRLFDEVQKPPLAPPAWLFPVAWTILYVLMGVASYLIYKKCYDSTKKKDALSIYVLQLIFNFGWSLFFFNLQWYWFSVVWLVILWVLILLTILSFKKIDRTAAWLLIPYIIWVTFAGYLNIGIAVLN